MLVSTIHKCVEGLNTNTVESYVVKGGSNVPSMKAYSKTQMFVYLVTLMIVYGLVLLLGKYLWNNVLVKLVPAVQPAKNIWQILGFVVLMSLIFQN